MTTEQEAQLNAAYEKVLTAERAMVDLKDQLEPGPEKNAMMDVTKQLGKAVNAFCDPALP